MEDYIDKSAALSGCLRYRYSLTRRWAHGACVNFIGLNPSTADAANDDATIRRCVGFAKAWGYGAFVMTNLFAWRATQPAQMKMATLPVGGALNEHHLKEAAAASSLVVACWGSHGAYMGRGDAVRKMLEGHGIRLQCLGVTASRQPRHPLYLAKNTELIPLPLV